MHTTSTCKRGVAKPHCTRVPYPPPPPGISIEHGITGMLYSPPNSIVAGGFFIKPHLANMMLVPSLATVLQPPQTCPPLQCVENLTCPVSSPARHCIPAGSRLSRYLTVGTDINSGRYPLSYHTNLDIVARNFQCPSTILYQILRLFNQT